MNILFAHQSAEMYGSDKVLLYLLEGLRGSPYHPIVLLPDDGPLKDELLSRGIETHIVPLTKVSRETLSPKGLLTLPRDLSVSLHAIDRVLVGRRVGVVYSNTLAVLAAAVWARRRHVPHLWHVHELIVSPAIVRKGFPWLLRLMADRVVCNSDMTRKWIISEQPRLAARSLTIWNGLGLRPSRNEKAAAMLRQYLGLRSDGVLVALVGRINRWKGQGVLVEAASILWDRGWRELSFVMVGGPPPGQEEFLVRLKEKIALSPAAVSMKVTDFTSDVWDVWDACDIAVVPSTEPEPFGMVAIEAMAAEKPVIAAAHGGLLEIVEDGVTGILVQPGDAVVLADSIERLLGAPALREQMGKAGRERQERMFSLETQVKATVQCLDELSQG